MLSKDVHLFELLILYFSVQIFIFNMKIYDLKPYSSDVRNHKLLAISGAIHSHSEFIRLINNCVLFIYITFKFIYEGNSEPEHLITFRFYIARREKSIPARKNVSCSINYRITRGKSGVRQSDKNNYLHTAISSGKCPLNRV